MAGIHRRNRMAPEMIQIFVIVNILNIISSSLATVESHGQAFIQTDNELRYMGDHIDGVPLHISGNKIQDIGLQDGGTTSGPIRFDPPSLDFRNQPVGMPHMEQVTVHNPDTKTSLHLLSISGSTLHFHCSFFQDKMVPPGGNTTFDVVFLARQVGTVENTLYIHTTQGSFKYQVVGIGVPNPYRIRPFIGAKVPLNSSYSPLIRMHNPHNSILQVVEMYSSGGDLHLELPTGEKEAPKNFWEIPPFETKPVMRASFVGRIENNHTAFIRIKTNRDKKDEVLILPVEVEVTASPGIFSPLEMLDFGILRTLDEPKTLRLNLLNSGFKPIHISSITVSPPNDAISIEFRPVKLQPDIIQTTPVALISYTASKAVHPNQWNGKVVVKSKNGQYKVAIPYQASVLHGSLVYDRNKTMFYTGQPPFKNVTRHLQITNTFNFTVVVYNVSVPDAGRRYFSVSVENVTGPLMLRPQETVSALLVQFHPNSTHLHLSTDIRLATNASLFVFPVVVYNGKLKVVHHRPEIYKGQLDFGTMGVGERRSMTFTLRNDNPVDIIIREFGANMEKTDVELLGVEKGNGTTLTRKHNLSEVDTNPLVLKPYHFAVFSVNLVAPGWEGTFAAEVIIVTQFENLYIPLTLRTAEGSLNAVPDKVVFEKCFPSKTPYQELKIHSSFDNYMEVRHVTFQPNDTRFYYQPPAQGKATLLEPQRDNLIGRIYFDAKKECQKDCYVGLPTYIPAGHQWLLGAALDKDVADTDQYLYTRFQQKWQLLGQHQLSTINVTIQLDTNQVRGFLFPAQAHLHWPSLVKKQKIKFPLTQIGNLSMAEFIVENPADVPVLVQILPLSLYPSPQTIVDMVTPKLAADLTDYIEMDDLDVFTLQDLEMHNPTPTNPLPGHRKAVENTLGVKPHRHTVTLMVGGGTKVRVRVGFTPKDDLSRTSLIIVRNNLTIVDTIVVQGQGGRGEMRLSNKKAGSSMPLLFDMTEKHLKSCDKKKQSKNTPPSFTVKRTFTARNTGQLPFYIHGFSISDSPCEGYGFKVLDCQGFELQPNSSRKVDIAFTPDFTMSRMRRTLSVHTSLGPAINYTLQASIPSHMLTRCAAALPRPPWEPILYYSALCIMAFLLFCILVASYFEADRIFTADILKRRSKVTSSQTTFDKSRVFDLKNIAGGGRVVPPAPATDTKCPPQQKAPAQEVTNGPREAQSARKSVLLKPLIFLKSLLTRRAPDDSGNRRPTTERQNSREKEVRNGTLTSTNNVKSPPASTDKQPSQSDITPPNNSDTKTPVSMKQMSNKRSKAAKRQQIDLISSSNTELSGINVNDSTNNNKKQANNARDLPTPNGTGVHRRVSDADHKTTYPEKEFNRSLSEPKSTPEPKVTPVQLAPSAYKKMERGSGMNQLDVIDSPDVTIISEALEDFKKEESKKLRQQKMRKVEARSQRPKKRVRPDLPVENDKDDASSTTTESSSAEADEKTSSARDSTPEPPTNKKKSRARKEKKRIEPEEDENNDDEFVITSKSKAHKKIKVDPKNAFGGNILRPSTIELPYTTRLEAAKADRLEPLTTSTIITERPGKKPGKNKGGKAKGAVAEAAVLVLTRSDTDSSSDRGSTGSPTWDMPKLRGQPDGDLSDLSLQTAIFAAKHGKPMFASGGASALTGHGSSSLTGHGGSSLAGTHGSSPDALSASSRSSSYSSVVSNGSNDTNRSKPGKFPTTGSNVEPAPSPQPQSPPQAQPQPQPQQQTQQPQPPTSAAQGSLGANMSASKKSAVLAGFLPEELKHPGAIGTRTVSPKPTPVSLTTAANNPMHKNPWTMAGSPVTPEGISGYGLHPIQEAQHPIVTGQPMPQDEAFVNSLKQANFDDGLGQYPIGNFEPPVTMMQRLRLERRKRLMEYQQRVVQGEDWPGFNIPVQTSFWDNNLNGSETWSTMTNSPPRHQQVAPQLWENAMSSSAGSTWTSDVSSIWSTNTNGSPADTMLASEQQPSPQAALASGGAGSAASGASGGGDGSPGVGTPPPVGSFDPFNTLGNTLGSIWRPSAGGNSSTWGFPPSKPDDVE